MRTLVRRIVVSLLAVFLQAAVFSFAFAQATGNTGAITGTVTDASGAVIPGATVSILNPVSGYSRSATTDNSGQYRFANVPLNPYHMVITAKGFAAFTRDVDVSSEVPITLKNRLSVGAAATTVTVSGQDLIEDDSTLHTDIDRGMFAKIPLESQSSSLSSLVTLTSPGVAADSNGLFHAWEIMPPTPSPLTASPLPTSKARSFPTSFLPTRFSPFRLSPARRRPSMETRPASSST